MDATQMTHCEALVVPQYLFESGACMTTPMNLAMRMNQVMNINVWDCLQRKSAVHMFLTVHLGCA